MSFSRCVATERQRGWWRTIAPALVFAHSLCVHAAPLPEPDAIVWGEVRTGGQALPPGRVVELRVRGQVVASYVSGAVAGIEGRYVLRVRLVSEGPPPVGAAIVGERDSRILVDGVDGGAGPILERGSLTRLDLSVEAAGSCGNGVIEAASGEECDGGSCCSSLSCKFKPVSSPCNGGDPCSRCDGHGACVAANDGNSCDNGKYCDGADDRCLSGVCLPSGVSPCPGSGECSGCDESRRLCVAPAGTPCSDDGNVCTTDVCDGAGTCGQSRNGFPCADAQWCNGDEVCAGTSCAAPGPRCPEARECVEAERVCRAPGCGDGRADNGEQCGEPELTCGVGERCVDCQCRACPSVALTCSEWAQSYENDTRSAALAFGTPVAADFDGVVLVTDRGFYVPRTVALNGKLAEGVCRSSGARRITCRGLRKAQNGEATEHSGEGLSIRARSLRPDDAHARSLAVEQLLDVNGETLAGCPLPPGCCISDDDCAPGLCTQSGQCGTDNTCKPGPAVELDDGVACTVDTCDPVTGPGHVAQDELCSDDDACSIDSCDLSTGCAHEQISPEEPGGAGVRCRIENARRLFTQVDPVVPPRPLRLISNGIHSLEALGARLAKVISSPACEKKIGPLLRRGTARTVKLRKVAAKLNRKSKLGPRGAEVVDLLDDVVAGWKQGAAAGRGLCP